MNFFSKIFNAKTSDLKLVVGLGNMGKDYQKTRHNAGFRAVDECSSGDANQWQEKKNLRGLLLEDGKTIFLKPTTMMNNSGEAVRAVMDFYRITPGRLLVIQDDWSLPIGEVKIKEKGSHSGHNGVRSIIAQLGTDEFERVRVGVRPANIDPKRDPMDFVLKNFSREDEQIFVEKSLPQVAECISDFIARP